MSRTGLSAFILALATLAACGKQEATPAPAVAPAPVSQAVGESCSKDCGGGKVAAIQCAEGETPVCDCAASPNAVCKVPVEPARP